MINIEIILLTILIFEVSYLIYNYSKQTKTKKQTRKVFVDTSVLIDGRILSIAQSGFMGGDNVLVPRSVVRELQLIADSSDSDKRLKARKGLDNLAELQAIPGLDINIFQDDPNAREGVDERLIKLAKKYRGSILTIDFNLLKVAKVENISVLNINDLAMNLRMSYLPGDKFLIELSQKGNEQSQAVGHLSDGTMVVVEDAKKHIGSIREVETIRSLQTSAGRMIFARLVNINKKGKPSSKSSGRSRATKSVSGEDRLIYLANR